jgi:hypothetical protein
VNGHVCPSCGVAIEAAGAVGRSARGRAVVAYVGHFSEQKAQRLRSMLSGDYPPMLPAWGALNQRPNAAPWSHLQKVIDRL